MLINDFDNAIVKTITNWTKEIKLDRESAKRLAQIGGEQDAFTEWMIKNIEKQGKKGWWNPMCLFRSYNLRGRDPGKDRSYQIRAEIRAATEVKILFKSGAWNKNHNKIIFEEWKNNNKILIQEALKKNAGNSNKQMNLFPEEVSVSSRDKLYEGAVKQITVNAYERDPIARQRCIDIHGLNCVVCGLNFEKKYGELGKGFIHVHHLNPLANNGKQHEIDPGNDLRPVCPNCHGMIHRKNPPYTIEEVKQRIMD